MAQIFSQHVTQKEMTIPILKNSFKVYVEQFDPDRIYLLQSEVEPFINPPDSDMEIYLNDYKKGNFSAYAKMDAIFRKSIDRARQWRQDFKNESESIFGTALKNPPNQKTLLDESLLSLPFATNTSELKQRNKEYLYRFIQAEALRFGTTAVMGHQARVMGLYEHQRYEEENPYLFQATSGEPLSDSAKQHQFVLHVLKSLAKSLDAHTSFFNTAEAYDMKARLEKDYEGIGLELQENIEGIIVSGLTSGAPAERSGKIQVNDVIISVNGESVVNSPLKEVVQMLRDGDAGSKVSLVLKKPENREYSVDLTREKITSNECRVEYSSSPFGDGIIGKLSLCSFYQNDDQSITSERDVRDAILNLKKEGNLRGLILDLRDNSGGYLTQAVKVAGLFVTNGVIVISKYSDGEEKFYRDIDGRRIFDGPLIVLTSRLTASAAEIVAQALQDYGVAVIVGDDRTYGKGSIQSQTVTSNEGSSFFKVTVGKYYTVSGKSPQVRGVPADIVVPGLNSQENIGEGELEGSLQATSNIEATFNDPLVDVPPTVKPWYIKYYLPTLQAKKDTWREMIPMLKKNSEFRIAHNKNYQLFMKKIGLKTAENNELLEGSDDDIYENPRSEDFGNDDLQMNEAINIVKDMVILHAKERLHFIGRD
jgi:carboxyl-terminal processing protease